MSVQEQETVTPPQTRPRHTEILLTFAKVCSDICASATALGIDPVEALLNADVTEYLWDMLDANAVLPFVDSLDDAA